ncbi:transglycosylase domain-containing protein [Mangrovivirga sp. M17]|uniref:Transglycosylase domain-containing protein n=1 Tax=Mangrovivirga halotolerans TaxID=2993936 RepID=A0ABT3RRB1_9BACT|nr:transglycosylase domain-containing protein [Mangrovivirga halotolerans]MCX2744323.1 transglycosylase domain-containing protein [Mangrovivirga halotolerans]
MTRPKQNKKKKILRITFRWAIGLFAIGVAIIGLFVGAIYIGIFGKLPDKDELRGFSNPEASMVYSADGETLGQYFYVNRQAVEKDEIPDYLINALVATEDVRFYDHEGIDFQSWFRVLVRTIILQQESAGGGSTITQQLVKNIYGRQEYPFLALPISKFKEAIIAGRIEDIYSKKDIVTMYLNTVPFGEEVYGIAAAADRYYSKKVEDLTVDEAAVLVGMLKANTYYNPRLNPENSFKRKSVVLSQMAKYGYISEDLRKEFSQKPINLNYNNRIVDTKAGYFVNQVKSQVQKILKDKTKDDGTPYVLEKDGLKITTTLDSRLQEKAERSVRDHLSRLQKLMNEDQSVKNTLSLNNPGFKAKVKRTEVFQKLKKKGFSEDKIYDSLRIKKKMRVFTWDGIEDVNFSVLDSIAYYESFLQSAVLSIDPSTGDVKAWVGGADFRFFPYDNVFARRQVGSTIKPFIYLGALNQGYNPCDFVANRVKTYVDYDDWSPKNAGNNSNEGKFSMMGGLANSVNLISIDWLLTIGPEYFVELLRYSGVESPLEPVPSLALGSFEIPVYEMAKAYTTILNDFPVDKLNLITKIEDNNGEVIYPVQEEVQKIAALENDEESNEPLFDESDRRIIIEFMQEVVRSGTATRLKNYKLKGEVAGKTGTTQNGADGWFVGYSPELLTVVWVGAPSPDVHFGNSSLAQGAAMALPIWGGIYSSISQDPQMSKEYLGRFRDLTTKEERMINCPMYKEDNIFDDIGDIFRNDEVSNDKLERRRKRKQFFRDLFKGKNKEKDQEEDEFEL